MDLLGVVRIADAADGMEFGVDTMGGGTAKQIHFVFTSGGDQQIRFLNTCL